MSTQRKGVEFFVGLFLLIGFAVIATMVVVFGRVGQGMQKSYSLKVRFPNASGLVKGSDVLLSGDRIGVVLQAPRLVGSRYQVEIEVAVRDTVQIPRASILQIRSNGMLGDSYVDVVPPGKFEEGDYWEPNETIPGKRTGGFDELTTKGSQVMDTLNTDVLKRVSETLDEIKVTTANLNEKLLSEKNLKNVEETFANLKTTSEDFSKTARNLDVMVGKAQEVVDSAKGTMKTIDDAAGDLQLTLGDFRKTSGSARSLLDTAASGDGALGMLMTNKEAAEDLKALISNMRRSGVLFYKDRALEKAESPTPRPPYRRR